MGSFRGSICASSHQGAHCSEIKGLTSRSIKAKPFNTSLKEVSFIRETVHGPTEMFLISHTIMQQAQLTAIGLW